MRGVHFWKMVEVKTKDVSNGLVYMHTPAPSMDGAVFWFQGKAGDTYKPLHPAFGFRGRLQHCDGTF
jgi:hypothetical protein